MSLGEALLSLARGHPTALGREGRRRVVLQRGGQRVEQGTAVAEGLEAPGFWSELCPSAGCVLVWVNGAAVCG